MFVLTPAEDVVPIILAAQAVMPPTVVYLTISAIIVPELLLSGLQAGQGNLSSVVVSHVVPPLLATTHALVSSFNEALSLFPGLGQNLSLYSVALEGYAISQFLYSIVMRMELALLGSNGGPTTELFTEFVSMPTSVPIFGYSSCSSCSQGLRQVWVTTATVSPSPSSFSLLRTYSYPCGSCYADPSQLQKFLVFGQSAAFSGGSALAGLQLMAGIRAAFGEQNRKGGVQGYLLQLRSLDDGYNPGPAAANAQTLVSQQVYGMIGAYGTPPSLAIAPITSAAGFPFVGAYTGIYDLRHPFDKNTINIRASYADETTAIVDYLTRQKFVSRFSIMYQNDSYGLGGLQALTESLSAIGKKILSSGAYTRNTIAVEGGLQSILEGARPMVPEAIIIFGASAAVVRFITVAKQSLPSSTMYVSVSFGGGSSLYSRLGSDIGNVYASQVVPLPTDGSSALVGAYGRALSQVRLPLSFNSSLVSAAKAVDWVSLEAYISARVTINTLQRVLPANITERGQFVDMVYSSSMFVLEELAVGPFFSGCNQGMKQIWMTSLSPTGYVLTPDYSFSFSPSCFSDVSVLRPPLVFGCVTSLSGAERPSGQAYYSGLLAGFQEQNEVGGIQGHSLGLTRFDDDSNATLSFSSSQALVSSGSLLAMFGTVSASEAIAVMKNTVPLGFPFIGPLSGSAELRLLFTRFPPVSNSVAILDVSVL